MVLSLDLIIVFERRNVLKGTSSPCCQRFMAISLVCGALFCFNLEEIKGVGMKLSWTLQRPMPMKLCV